MKLLRLAIAVAACAAALAVAFAQEPDRRLRERLLETALSFKGVPYVYGAESPTAFDCSGFVRWVYRQATGMELPRSARDYMGVGVSIAASDARPGDLFVFNTVGSYASHVAMFIGGGKLIHAVSDGPRTGVIESSVDERYWASRLVSVRSVLVSADTSPDGARPTLPSAVAGPTAGPTVRPAPGPSVVDIGFVIQPGKEAYADPVPTAAGTSLAFTVTNGTGKADSFIAVFFMIDAKTYRLREISSQKIKLGAGESFSLPAYEFADAGKYRLVIKGDWGTHLVERTFVVEAAGGK